MPSILPFLICQFFITLTVSSTFWVFRQLYENYIKDAKENLKPLLSSEDYINTEVALPVSAITENLPVLRVSKLV